VYQASPAGALLARHLLFLKTSDLGFTVVGLMMTGRMGAGENQFTHIVNRSFTLAAVQPKEYWLAAFSTKHA